MGNEQSSKLKGLDLDKNAVEANDFWTLYNAESPTTSNESNEEGKQLLSIFQGETIVNGQLWVPHGPMERAIKNLKIYRHPYILKYVTTWEKGGQKHLATERVRPLVAVLTTQSEIQVCLGLRTILCSLIFLIEKAMARHLNICASSIYITENGSWRLAGFEYVWKHKEVTKSLLDLANAYRYQPAIDPCETKENITDCIEQYAFATFCEEILAKCTPKESAAPTPHVQEFREYCATHLKHKNATMRPKLAAVLLHPYFNHEFVLIHSFLFELPLKNVQEKQDFFTGLIDRLRYFNEEVVGAQLAADLLSRMVLLDPTAQLCVTPYVLKTKTDHTAALFSQQTYTRHLMPHIKRMFRLRDAQIRLILLEYFMEYVRLLTEEELQEFILPHLLAGMNDTNDILVAKTLRCLADLVPILGAATVIGGQRVRLFSDGRPQAAVPDSTSHWVEPRSITPVLGNSVDYMVSGSPLPTENGELSSSFNSLVQDEANDVAQLEMPPRLSPDGGEDEKSGIVMDGTLNGHDSEAGSTNLTEDTTYAATALHIATPHLPLDITDADDEDAWSDWETDELQRLNGAAAKSHEPNAKPEPLSSSSRATQDSTHANTPASLCSSSSSSAQPLLTAKVLKPKINDDLNALDIIVQKTTTPAHEQGGEFDFFKDMEPVIETKHRAPHEHIPKSTPLDDEDVRIDASRFAAAQNGTGESDGWIVEDDDDDNAEAAGASVVGFAHVPTEAIAWNA